MLWSCVEERGEVQVKVEDEWDLDGPTEKEKDKRVVLKYYRCIKKRQTEMVSVDAGDNIKVGVSDTLQKPLMEAVRRRFEEVALVISGQIIHVYHTETCK